MTDIRERYEAAAALLQEHGWNDACFDAIIGDLFPRLAPVLDELDRLRATEERARTQVSQSADAMQAMRESAIRDIVRLRGRLEVEVLQHADARTALDDEREAHRHTRAAFAEAAEWGFEHPRADPELPQDDAQLFAHIRELAAQSRRLRDAEAELVCLRSMVADAEQLRAEVKRGQAAQRTLAYLGKRSLPQLLNQQPTMAHSPLPEGREGERVVVLIGGTPVVMPWSGGKWGPSHGWHVPGFVCTWARLPQEVE